MRQILLLNKIQYPRTLTGFSGGCSRSLRLGRCLLVAAIGDIGLRLIICSALIFICAGGRCIIYAYIYR